MAFITGIILIDAPASALNNSGEEIPGARTDNTSAVKFIRTTGNKTYPYVSAQAVRYWLRDTLETATDIEWKSSPIRREEKVAYTDGNPIDYWDDDLFGYMRAPSKREKKASDPETAVELTELETDAKGKPKPVTRAAPLRVSTFVSISPVNITTDFGVMARHQGDPVPFEHQFYRAILQGLFSLDLGMAGKFYYRRRTGFQNLDSVRRELASKANLTHLQDESAYVLCQGERLQRIDALLRGLAALRGGAKQSVHYTDVSPAVMICAVIRGGNHPFNYLVSEERDELRFRADVLRQAIADLGDDLLSPIYVGWKPGFASEAQRELTEALAKNSVKPEIVPPRSAMRALSAWLKDNPHLWDDQEKVAHDG